ARRPNRAVRLPRRPGPRKRRVRLCRGLARHRAPGARRHDHPGSRHRRRDRLGRRRRPVARARDREGRGMTAAAEVAGAVPRRRRFAEASASYAGFLPAIVLFGAFFLVPLGIIVAYSFWEVVNYQVVHHWTLGNYRYFFSVSTYVTTMWATLWVA